MDFLSVISKGSQRDKVWIPVTTLFVCVTTGWYYIGKGGGSFDKRNFFLLTKNYSQDDSIQIIWTFNFYDVNRDGCISRDEMMKVHKDQPAMYCNDIAILKHWCYYAHVDLDVVEDGILGRWLTPSWTWWGRLLAPRAIPGSRCRIWRRSRLSSSSHCRAKPHQA